MENVVRKACAGVCTQAQNVKISQSAIKRFVAGLDQQFLKSLCQRKKIDTNPELEYRHLSEGLKHAILADPDQFEAERLQKIQGQDIRRWIGWSVPVPLEEERARLIREVGYGLESFEGTAEALIKSADHSVLKLVSILTKEFPGFRDQAVYNGEQVFLYKRAQIFAGDVWGSFAGTGLGEFHDIHELTMFPDYRIPQFLLHLKILNYSPLLLQKVSNQELLEPGCSLEVEIRASSVMAIEAIKEEIGTVYGKDLIPMSVQLDWWLWEEAESIQLDDKLQHHTLTLFY